MFVAKVLKYERHHVLVRCLRLQRLRLLVFEALTLHLEWLGTH